MYLSAALPPPPQAFFSAIEHGRLHPGNEHQRMLEWQRMKAQGVKQGLCDLFIIAWKRFIAVELKVGRNSTSDAQNLFGAACYANGHHYLVCRSVADLDEGLRRIGLPIPRSMQIAAMEHDAALSQPEPPRRRSTRAWPSPDAADARGDTEAQASANRLQHWLDEAE